jgi:Predicted metal-dependent RNase, consists of a metallo-beta-lactamase domain and an RNA-binding KH domain
MFAGEWEDILEQTKMAVLEYAPSINITSIDFEASIIVVYTKDIDFFTENPDVVKQIAQKIRRRISIRPDPSILMDENEAREEIMKIVPLRQGYQIFILSLKPVRW